MRYAVTPSIVCWTAYSPRCHAQADSVDVKGDEDLADGDRLVADASLVKEKKGLLGPKKEADYDYFVSDIWPRISTKEEKQSMTAPLVWQVLLFAVVQDCTVAHTSVNVRAG